jgi:hypothetical protein
MYYVRVLFLLIFGALIALSAYDALRSGQFRKSGLVRKKDHPFFYWFGVAGMTLWSLFFFAAAFWMAK